MTRPITAYGAKEKLGYNFEKSVPVFNQQPSNQEACRAEDVKAVIKVICE